MNSDDEGPSRGAIGPDGDDISLPKATINKIISGK